jgi:hypothetical protein
MVSPPGQTVDLCYQLSPFIGRSEKWGYEIGGFIMTITPPYWSDKFMVKNKPAVVLHLLTLRTLLLKNSFPKKKLKHIFNDILEIQQNL